MDFTFTSHMFTGQIWFQVNSRASDRSQRKKSNFAGFLGTNSRKNRPISREYRGKFQGKLRQKAIGKKRPILWLFSRQISLEIDRFCSDQNIVFNVFLTEVIICSFNNNMLKKWTNSKVFNIMASAQFFATYSCLMNAVCTFQWWCFKKNWQV